MMNNHIHRVMRLFHVRDAHPVHYLEVWSISLPLLVGCNLPSNSFALLQRCRIFLNDNNYDDKVLCLGST